MTIAWLQLVGGPRYGEDGPDFSGVADTRAWTALRELETELLSEFDGGRWLAQGGYERVAIHLEYRSDKRGRARRKIGETGRLLTPSLSLVWPELETASVGEIKDHLRPVVLEAFALVGERKKFGQLPRAGEAAGLQTVPLKPLIEDPAPYDEEPGDCFVITRDFPPDVEEAQLPELFRRYEEDLEELLSDEGMDSVLDMETSATAARWVVRIVREED
ncbi:hypothetical protein [Kribbella solani]|uniref:Uncharacterized protein n=1 Tax=Kribbella solani TaxID=236067 RepID=A0A841DMT8_9ACTN|nr:hypothetical protein [Kribbella solani]MBB5979852.1 hypothetical protein [Kribbella solani]